MAVVRTPSSRRFATWKATHYQPIRDEPMQLHRVRTIVAQSPWDGRDKPGHDGGQHFRPLL
jgi:hypothetical protein